MAISLTVTEKDNIQHAIDLMVKGSARETPFDSTVIENVQKAAISIGYVPSGGRTFQQAVQDNPFSTLLDLLLFVGA